MTRPLDPDIQQPEPRAVPPSDTPVPAAPPLSVGYAYAQPGPGGMEVPPGMYFDQPSGLSLPEGVRLASTGRRVGAFFLAIPLSIVTLGIGYLIWGLIVWGRGQTPALQVLGMRCWRPETGRIAGWGWMAMREIIGRVAENILALLTEILSLILMVTTKERRTLHDMVAGTVVLHDPDKVLQGVRRPGWRQGCSSWWQARVSAARRSQRPSPAGLRD